MSAVELVCEMTTKITNIFNIKIECVGSKKGKHNAVGRIL